MSRSTLLVFCAMALLASPPGELLAQEETRPREPGWVGLFSTPALGWLENENRLSALCGRPSVDRIEEWTKCEAEKTSPMILAFPVMREPDPGAERLGTVIVSAVPGSGLTAHYVPAGETRAQPFPPDLYDRDWGYGPYFHQPFLKREDGWFLLPEDPFPGPVWVQIGRAEEPRVERLYAGEIIRTAVGDMVVLEVTDGSVRVRPEQPADMWCEEGDPSPLEPFEETLLTSADLYDHRGHLTIRPKYLRGC
jgi:hypothetical protein